MKTKTFLSIKFKELVKKVRLGKPGKWLRWLSTSGAMCKQNQ